MRQQGLNECAGTSFARLMGRIFLIYPRSLFTITSTELYFEFTRILRGRFPNTAMNRKLVVTSMLLVFFASVSLFAGDPKPGQTTTVTTKHNDNQKYACYLPSKYTEKEPWPILYCFDAGARGGKFVSRFRELGEKYGWIIVGSLNSENGPWERIQKACEAMFKDTEKRFNLSDYLRYATGFSGGAEAAFNLTDQHHEITGVLPIANTRSSSRARDIGAGALRKTVRVFITTGKNGFNYEGMKDWAEGKRESGYTVKGRWFDGGHEMPPDSVLKEGVKWLIDKGPGWAAMKVKERKDDKGVKINHVMQGGPASKAGLSEGDVIRKVNGEKIKNKKAYVLAMQDTDAEEEITISIKSSGGIGGSGNDKLQEKTIKLMKRVPQ